MVAAFKSKFKTRQSLSFHLSDLKFIKKVLPRCLCMRSNKLECLQEIFLGKS
jgi:hypothetical protein